MGISRRGIKVGVAVGKISRLTIFSPLYLATLRLHYIALEKRRLFKVNDGAFVLRTPGKHSV